MNAELAAVMAHSGPVLLDFDGPLCSIFAGYPAPEVAARLVAVVQQCGGDADGLARLSDPLEVLRRAAENNSRALVHELDDALREAELEAAQTATETPGASHVLFAAHHSGHPVAVVSNNSAAAVEAFLTARNWDPHVSEVIGRAEGRPDWMKPNPYPVLLAARRLHVDVRDCCLIGDSVTDIDSALAAGALAVGYANKPGKRPLLERAGSSAIVESMSELADALLP